jgi:predicted ATPase
VLEDLHDADRGTLDLLLYLARNLHGARILVVGTYRDVEVDRAHPLSAALTELHRASNVGRVQLHGLSTVEVQQLLAEASQHTIPQPFAELVQRQTEGNPLSVRRCVSSSTQVWWNGAMVLCGGWANRVCPVGYLKACATRSASDCRG